MTTTDHRLMLLTTTGPAGYRLLDCGGGRKLERFGDVMIDRPEPQAMWRPALDQRRWSQADAIFSAAGEDQDKGRWRLNRDLPPAWPIDVGEIKIICKCSGLWHVGVFPEQLPHWQWMLDRLAATTGPPPVVLNLFGYTGAASLLAARAGAQVVHVDASKKAISWARDNQAAAGLGDKPIRWICEDARKFVAREVRRGRSYHVILIDPPKFGRGPEGEVWDLFTHLPALLADCAKLVTASNAHVILTAYAIRASALTLDGLMRETFAERAGTVESGELALIEHSRQRLLGTSIFTRWSAP